MTVQPALFEVQPADDREVSAGPHVLMPNMAYACGGSILTKTGGFVVGVGVGALNRVGCPECAGVGYAGLRAEIQRQQGQQAEVRA